MWFKLKPAYELVECNGEFAIRRTLTGRFLDFENDGMFWHTKASRYYLSNCWTTKKDKAERMLRKLMV